MTLVPGFDVKKPFGSSVRSWRNRLGISQEQLAKRAGLHRTYVCDVERGARNVSLESIDKLARALEIPLATLFSYQSSPSPPAAEKIPDEALVDILFVEDDPRDADLALQALKSVTNRVQLARDGQAALDLLFGQGQCAGRQQSRRPQLVLLDLGLPKIDGLEVLRRIKSDPRTASIPVVALTSSTRDRDIQASRQLGALACIVKPVDLPNLTQVTPQLSLQWALLKVPPAPPALRP
jgi:CheY-like chemotaxis protein/plasmid maintenance system antidote protein VapI